MVYDKLMSMSVFLIRLHSRGQKNHCDLGDLLVTWFMSITVNGTARLLLTEKILTSSCNKINSHILHQIPVLNYVIAFYVM